MYPRLKFRRAQVRDAGRLTAIAFAAKRHWGYPDEWLEAWRHDFTVTPAYLRAQPVYVAKLANRIVGFFGLKLLEDTWSLEHLWLRPALIGQGFGQELFAEALRQARAVGAIELRIKSDPNAEPFYLKRGARRTGLEACCLWGNVLREVPLLTFSIR